DLMIEPLRHRLERGLAADTVLSYLKAGNQDGPRVILVHGTPGSASAWADYLTQPPPGVEVLALDRPGFGHSGPAGAVTGLAEQAAAVVA
ncbi:alpha/beta fold hydrolase, partial [Acinetobacter baumannii]